MIYGFIGTGNMGSALAIAVDKDGRNEILLANRTVAKAEKLSQKIKSKVSTNKEIAAKADVIFLGVKPQFMQDVFDEIAPILSNRTDHFILVSMAAGLSMDDIVKKSTVDNCPIVRIMPNTPIAIGEGIILYDYKNIEESEVDDLLSSLSCCGMIEYLPEKLIPAASSVAGCGPAFVDMFIEALSDGAVLCGLPRAKAIALASKMVMGSAALVLESGKHPGQLKDEVTSPGGTTIEGVRALENGGFRASVMNAVIAATQKNDKLKG